jgi:hypothetical protein
MRWPDTCKLIDRIREDRPELTVDHYGSGGADGHYTLRLYCMVKDSTVPEGRRLIRESLDTIYGADGWKRYKERHPDPWCSPEDSYHTNALGQEVDHRGQPGSKAAPPPAQAVSAEDMLSKIIALNRSNPDWWKDASKVAELAAAWGVRTRANGVMADCEQEEIVRLSGDCHASILIARTGSGLFASGILARWGNGGTCMEPSVGSVPYDTEPEARRAAYRELIETLQAGRRAAQDQQRMLLLEAVKKKDRDRGLFG